MDESALVAAIQRGEEVAYEHVVREYGPRLLAAAHRILRDAHAAQDALQEAMISALRHIDRFEGQAKLSTWLHRIVVNAALMRLRQRKRLAEVSMDTVGPTFDRHGFQMGNSSAWPRQPIDVLKQEERNAFIHESIARLPDTHREVLLMRDIQELSTEQTAAQLQITPGAVKVRLHRARQALRDLLDPYMMGEDEI